MTKATQELPNSKKKDSFFDPRETAVLRHVWFLEESERKLLDLHILRKTKIDTLLGYLNQDHEFRDSLTFQGLRYEVEYHRTTYDHLENLLNDYPDMEVFLSIRRRDSKSFAVVLLWPIFIAKHDSEFLKKVPELNLSDLGKKEVEE